MFVLLSRQFRGDHIHHSGRKNKQADCTEPTAMRVKWQRVSPEEFNRLVQAAYDRIPDKFRSRMENIAVIVEPEPTSRQLALARVPSGATLFGLYEGRPLTVRSVFDSFAMPDRITIFQAPHEHAARSPEHLAKLVEDTIWHEVAHYFGMNESQVRSAERARRYPQRRPGTRGNLPR
jgi:predicted Zn-dependent protease with MMP-like domain